MLVSSSSLLIALLASADPVSLHHVFMTATIVGAVDRLTMLGPRPIIASLSLGATRTFRLRCMAAQGARLHTSRLQQEPDQAAPASQHADHTPSLASSAQTTMNVGLQHIQQRQAHSSPRVTDSGVSAHPAQPEGKAQQADAAQQAQEEAPVSSIDVVLPHNTLVIMWPPMQEAWKHEVLGSVVVSMNCHTAQHAAVPSSTRQMSCGPEHKDGQV